MRSPNSFKTNPRGRPRAAFGNNDRESHYPHSHIGWIGGNTARLLWPLGYVIAIGLATWGAAHLVDTAPSPTTATCVTSGIRSVVTADLWGTGEICTAGAAARASVKVDQLRPGGTYTTMLVYDLDPLIACPKVCVPDPAPRALPNRTVRVVDTSNADQSGWLQDSQEIAAPNPAPGSTVQLWLTEFVQGPVPLLVELGVPVAARHRVDRLADIDSETPVAEAAFQLP